MLRGHFLLFSSSLSSLPSSVSLLSMVRLEATCVCYLRELVMETAFLLQKLEMATSFCQ